MDARRQDVRADLQLARRIPAEFRGKRNVGLVFFFSLVVVADVGADDFVVGVEDGVGAQQLDAAEAEFAARERGVEAFLPVVEVDGNALEVFISDGEASGAQFGREVIVTGQPDVQAAAIFDVGRRQDEFEQLAGIEELEGEVVVGGILLRRAFVGKQRRKFLGRQISHLLDEGGDGLRADIGPVEEL